jgi:fructose-bisphosphate aldolase class 1
MSQDLESIAATLVADGKGILAADERARCNSAATRGEYTDQMEAG